MEVLVLGALLTALAVIAGFVYYVYIRFSPNYFHFRHRAPKTDLTEGEYPD